jgi:hypothetical protein
VVARDPSWVASGPVFGSDWCVVPNAPAGLVAPGGVVLCLIGTTTPHPDAAKAATAGWDMLNQWIRNELERE